MSDDEKFVLTVSLLGGLVMWVRWYWGLLRPVSGRHGAAPRVLCALIPPATILLLGLLLRGFAASDVRNSSTYLPFYIVFGMGWLGVAASMTPLFGLSPKQDVAIRGSGSAAIALSGVLLGLMLALAGGNFGDGPGWWVIVFSSGLATGAFFTSWGIVQACTDVSEQITVERSIAAGIRLGGFLLAIGAIFGRAAVGNWVSAGATILDFVRWGWPGAVLILIECGVGRIAGPSPERPAPEISLFGFAPAVLYLGIAAVTVATLGPWW